MIANRMKTGRLGAVSLVVATALAAPVATAQAADPPPQPTAPMAALPEECEPGAGKVPPWLRKLPVAKQKEFTSKQWYQDWLKTTLSLCTDLTHLAADNPGRTLKWRTDKALLFRGAGLGSHSVPEHVFTAGADPWDLTAGGNLTIRPGEKIKNSALSSTTYRSRHSRHFGLWNYVIDAPGGIQVDGMLYGDPMDNESEIAFPGGIRPEYVMAAYRLADKGVWQKAVEYRWNPNYKGSVPKPNADEINVVLGTGPRLPGAAMTAKGGRSVDPLGRVLRLPKSATGTTLATDTKTNDPLYVPWGSVPGYWATKQQDPSIDSRAMPYATCHTLDQYEFAPGIGGMVDALWISEGSKVAPLKNKFLMEPATCYNSGKPPQLVQGIANGNKTALTVSWTAPGEDGIKAYAIYGRASDTSAWKRLATVGSPQQTQRVLKAAELKPFTLADVDPAQHRRRLAVTAVAADGGHTTMMAACGFPVVEPYATKWQAAGGEAGPFGCPTTPVRPKANDGAYQGFETAMIYATKAGGAHAVTQPFLHAYSRVKYQSGVLGYPVSDLVNTPNGRRQDFQGGGLVYDKKTKKVTVERKCHVTPYGSFAVKWQQFGGMAGKLGCATASQGRAPAGGQVQYFQGGVMFWSKVTGAHVVSGPFQGAYAKLHYDQGRLGYPSSDERSDSRSSWQHFQHGALIRDKKTGKITTKWT
ncbi:scabin-related ADP-ribosyltransferase [Streptomyces sp. NBC_01304]|uniref:scabin-related ADP-ribosyltransferase n=1 Tax=Streptomyces sp. NBC_01304 TaxID=2903818 RepID=UPI002E145DD9|nr:hypothetical protein OG430_01970 [Streptomyces sp. NBC_01304]